MGSVEGFLQEGVRLLLVYAHLLLCVFALQRVLVTDWRVLRGTISRNELKRTHRLMIVLLAGLWLTGLALIGIDLGGQTALLVERPKAVVKLGVVLLLSANGVLIDRWCLPRIVSGRRLALGERTALVATVALSTAGWMLAAFIGTARPAVTWGLSAWLLLAAAALGLALAAAVVLAGSGRWPLLAARPARSNARGAAPLQPIMRNQPAEQA